MRKAKQVVLSFTLFLAGCLPVIPGLAPDAGDLTTPARGYERFFSPAPHNFRYAVADDGAPVRYGARAERYELRTGDCGGSDCGNARYRAEIRMTDDSNPAKIGEDIWYGWSFYNSSVPGFFRDESLRLVFGQWTMGGDANPAIRLIQLGEGEGNWDSCRRAICAGPERATGDVVIQLEDLRRTFNWGDGENQGYVCRLFDMQDNTRSWVDLVMQTNFSQGTDGYLRVWVNGALKCDYSGPIVSPKSLFEGDTPGHRRGVFSSYTTRWDDTHGRRPKPTLVVYYDEFRVGKSRADVDTRWRIAAGEPAVD
ncbi:heparin lyase I family protein [Tropicibacter oceani]|uniref:Heparin lyase I family protein n=1 Tax=Tropicibacter oceani TaxID=3058420 RepID=A0ABY8QJH0_9RHOB|nr:heparin lyase I family protein [Tropicibacter oceani]WGW04292.1 heparin lyase I family protein [Tropicibacter oceani]